MQNAKRQPIYKGMIVETSRCGVSIFSNQPLKHVYIQ